jgi:hypothetical protein
MAVRRSSSVHHDRITIALVAQHDTRMPPPTPRWVKVFGIIAAALVLLFIILHLTGRGLGGH